LEASAAQPWSSKAVARFMSSSVFRIVPHGVLALVCIIELRNGEEERERKRERERGRERKEERERGRETGGGGRERGRGGLTVYIRQKSTVYIQRQARERALAGGSA